MAPIKLRLAILLLMLLRVLFSLLLLFVIALFSLWWTRDERSDFPSSSANPNPKTKDTYEVHH